jgi:hypothetical protein
MASTTGNEGVVLLARESERYFSQLGNVLGLKIPSFSANVVAAANSQALSASPFSGREFSGWLYLLADVATKRISLIQLGYQPFARTATACSPASMASSIGWAELAHGLRFFAMTARSGMDNRVLGSAPFTPRSRVFAEAIATAAFSHPGLELFADTATTRLCCGFHGPIVPA